MKRFAIASLACLVGICSLGFLALSSSESGAYFKISKSLQIFGDLFRQLSNDYVDEIDPQEFIHAGIDGMLKYLDPYTIYINDDERDEVEILTTGIYGGLGITTGIVDSCVTIMSVAENSPAEKAGLRIGDKLYMVDSTVVLKAYNDELRKLTRGKPGTNVTVRALRAGCKDTLSMQIARREVTLKNVSYSGIASDGIGYIKLERFTHGAVSETQDALSSLRKQNPNLKGLILDLRDNPGGLLDAAIGICELFVPPSSLIVTTRGRAQDTEHRYLSRRAPIEPNLPLAVLIDEQSASASEVLAGCIQDLDRGVIVGERSFGKGLVQTISSLPFNASLKMTTAKYYTPSGRCIQKIDYSARHAAGRGIVKTATDTNKVYRTANGRIVRESNGINPDTLVSPKAVAPIIGELLTRNILFNFANEFSGKRTSLEKDFTVSKTLLDEFAAFARRKSGTPTNSTIRKIEEVESALKRENVSAATLKQLAALKTQVSAEQIRDLDKQRSVIKSLLYEEILERFYPRSKVIAATLKDDLDAQTAIGFLSKSELYARTLGQKRE